MSEERFYWRSCLRAGYAITDEFHQTFVEGRHGTPGGLADRLGRSRARGGPALADARQVRGMMRRVPIDSAAPVMVFAMSRLVVSIAALTAVAIVGFPYHGRAGLVLGRRSSCGRSRCWLTARREPERALHPVVPAIDFALLLALELVAPGHASSACSSPRCSWSRPTRTSRASGAE